jgi:hypothetical protein
MQRASYRYAIAWIALNDNLGDDEAEDVLRGYLTVVMVADLFGVEPDRVAADVAKYRKKNCEPG